MQPTDLFCICDTYTPSQELFTGVSEFLEHCQAVFGTAPELTEQAGCWYDEEGQLVLTPVTFSRAKQPTERLFALWPE